MCFKILIVGNFIFFLDFDSQDLGGSSVLDGDYLTMLGSSDKLMSGEFEALERLQAELDLFDDPNRPEEIVEQMAVENHLDIIEEEVCLDTSGSMICDETSHVKDEIIIDSESEPESSVQVDESQHTQQMKLGPVEQENVVITLKQPQSHSNPENISVNSSNATKRSAPPCTQGNQQSKKPVIC